MRGERPAGRKVVEKVAGELAEAFSVEGISASVREAWAEAHPLEELGLRARRARQELEQRLAGLLSDAHRLDDLRERARGARNQLEERLAELSLPHLPTIPELREKAEEMFHESPSLDAVVDRAHQLLAAAVAAHLCEAALAVA